MKILLVSMFVSLGLLGVNGSAEVVGPPLPPRDEVPRYSQRYTVQVGQDRLPMLERFERGAKNLDKNRDGLLSNKELAKLAEDLPGDLRVDVGDYTLGIAHQFTGTLSTYRGAYLSAQEIENRLKELVAMYPERLTVTTLGKTPEGRALQALRIGAGERSVNRPKVAIVAGQHAREWIAPQVALQTVEALLADPENADLLERFEFWVVPLANPDGYEFSRDVNPMWRKNRRHDTAHQVGIDLNRNFPYFFRQENDTDSDTEDDWGASDHPASDQYRGPSANSEPETQAIVDLLALEGLTGVIDLHGFGCKVVLPNKGHRVDEAIYQRAAKDMLEVLGSDYEALHYKDLYPITGTLTDYADHLNIVGITFEIGTSFQPRPSKIREYSDTGTRGVLAFIRTLQNRGVPQTIKRRSGEYMP